MATPRHIILVAHSNLSFAKLQATRIDLMAFNEQVVSFRSSINVYISVARSYFMT